MLIVLKCEVMIYCSPYNQWRGFITSVSVSDTDSFISMVSICSCYCTCLYLETALVKCVTDNAIGLVRGILQYLCWLMVKFCSFTVRSFSSLLQ